MKVDGEVIGTFSIAAAEADAFDTDEFPLLAELADDLAYGISNLRVRARQHETQAMIERVAFYDSLTGLPNRITLRNHLVTALDFIKLAENTGLITPLPHWVLEAARRQSTRGTRTEWTCQFR